MLSSISSHRGQAIAEAALVLPLLVMILLFIMAFSEREESVFQAFLIARNAGLSRQIPAGVDQRPVSFIKGSAEEEMTRLDYMQAITQKNLSENIIEVSVNAIDMQKIKVVDAKTSEIIPLPAAAAQKVYAVMDPWNAQATGDEIRTKSLEWVAYH